MKNKLGLAQGFDKVLLPPATKKRKTVLIHFLVYTMNKFVCTEHTGLLVIVHVFIIQRAEILKT